MVMTNSIFMSLMKHIDYLECLRNNTREILNCKDVKNVDELSSLTDNRQRLINLIKNYQSSVLTELKGFINENPNLDETIKDIFKAWGSDTNLILNETKVLEKSASEALTVKKEELRKDILDLQNERKLVRKYSLSNVK